MRPAAVVGTTRKPLEVVIVPSTDPAGHSKDEGSQLSPPTADNACPKNPTMPTATKAPASSTGTLLQPPTHRKAATTMIPLKTSPMQPMPKIIKAENTLIRRLQSGTMKARSPGAASRRCGAWFILHPTEAATVSGLPSLPCRLLGRG